MNEHTVIFAQNEDSNIPSKQSSFLEDLNHRRTAKSRGLFLENTGEVGLSEQPEYGCVLMFGKVWPTSGYTTIDSCAILKLPGTSKP